MIDGRFEESARLADQALAMIDEVPAPSRKAIAIRAHAICTKGVNVAYLGDPRTGLELLEDAASLSREAGRLDDLMRTAANRTTLLDLDLRREEALAVVQEFLAEAAAGGLGATFGAFLRGNAADILYQLGRWAEAERVCRADIKWLSSRREVAWLSLLVLGLLLTESRADEEATAVVGQTLLELQAASPGQPTGIVLRSAVSLALWNGRVVEALGIAEREWPRAVESDQLNVICYAASTVLEAAAAAAEHGRATSDTGLIARARELADGVLAAAEQRLSASHLGPEAGARRESELLIDVARAHVARVRGRADPARWDALAQAWEAQAQPYQRAKARWWQALAILGAAGTEEERESARAAAGAPLAEAYRIARELPALPLLREVVDLGTRARVPLPVEVESAESAEAMARDERKPVAVGPGQRVAVGPGRAPGQSSLDIAREIDERVISVLRRGPADRYGLSPREREVLNILAEGRTDRDIAGRLFISERTVHVHVRRILAKLGVSSRTEAAGVAIREGLVPGESSSTAGTRRTE
jgi:DNA-binding CsgD family transcriptional regulator/tetratricopeptide (TPR) repeat protein